MSVLGTQIEQVSKWIERITFDDIPANVITLAKIQSLDCLAAICAGSGSQIGQKVYQSLKKRQSSGDVIILPFQEHWRLLDAVYYHATMINALEMDNFSFMGHLSQSAFSASLALAYQGNKSGNDFLLSLIIAQEVAGRLSAYMSSGPLQGHMRSYIHRISGAIVVTKMNKCKANIIANAIAISLSGPEFYMIPTSFSADTKVTSTSGAVVEGINSGFLAMERISGALDLLEHPAGFVAMFSYLKYVPDFWERIGTTWVMESISFKFFASCAYAQGPVNAGIKIRQKIKHRKMEDIERIEVHAPLLSLVMENFSSPHYNSGLNQVNINFSTKRSLALTLLFGGPDGKFFMNSNVEGRYRQIEDLSKKISLHHSWKLTIDMIMGFDNAISNPGYPGVFGMSDSQKALKKTRNVYQNRTLFEWGDFKQLMSLPKGHFSYLLSRYFNSIKGKYWSKGVKSHELDLSKLEFKLGAEVVVIFKDGSHVKEKCEIPKGFAGDAFKIEAVFEKYQREVVPILGIEKANLLKENILDMESKSIRNLFS